jgi:hypothetical protein
MSISFMTFMPSRSSALMFFGTRPWNSNGLGRSEGVWSADLVSIIGAVRGLGER